jgi:hypothetical protein
MFYYISFVAYKAGAYLHYKMCSRKLGNVLLLDTAPLHMYVCSTIYSYAALAFGDRKASVKGRLAGSIIQIKIVLSFLLMHIMFL